MSDRGNGASIDGAMHVAGSAFHQIEGEAEPPPRTLDLDIDVMWHAQHITRLHLQEPTMKQMEAAERELGNSPTPSQFRRFQIALVAAVARVDKQVVEQMPVSQAQEAFNFLSRLLARGQQTGENSSPI